MKFNNSQIIKISILLFYSFLIISCHQTTVELENIQTIEVENGQALEIKKTDKNTTSIGMITNHNYGTSHHYSYEMTLDDDIYWYGGSHEPKQILFYNDNVYLRYLYQKRYNTSTVDSLTQETKTSHYYRIEEDFQKHVDERYFFNWFGKDYWVNIDSTQFYSHQKMGQEYDIPNDGELSIKH